MYVNLYFSKRPKEYLTTSLDNVENTTNERLVWYDKLYDVENEDVLAVKGSDQETIIIVHNFSDNCNCVQCNGYYTGIDDCPMDYSACNYGYDTCTSSTGYCYTGYTYTYPDAGCGSSK